MNGNRYLLDSNIIIALFGGDQGVLMQASKAEEVFIASIVVGELYYGAQKSSKRQTNVARVDRLASANTILSCDQETARWYGQTKNELKEKGRPIPENDIWIAALARQYHLILVTRDKHFSEINDLRLEAW
ncbi:MAG: type II toxin-antitoxin system VapC family toxin [Chloroflexota bacterium]